MIPNRVFVALFGAALIAVAVIHATTAPVEFGAVVLPALAGLWLLNVATRRRQLHGPRGFCGGHHRHQAAGGPQAGA
jgi:hypothetical protein